MLCEPFPRGGLSRKSIGTPPTQPISCAARNCPRRDLPLRCSRKAPSSLPVKPAKTVLKSKPLRRRGNSGSFRPDQVLSGRSKSGAAPDCASRSASSRNTFATWRSSLRAGPGFSRRASTRKSLACKQPDGRFSGDLHVRHGVPHHESMTCVDQAKEPALPRRAPALGSSTQASGANQA
jgi:hypothetical protein